MGFFSWITQDTQKSIANSYSGRKFFPVTMTDNKGNKWYEPKYEGYGVFGGKDFYELTAEMNGQTTRDEGIKLFFGGPGGRASNPAPLSPNLNEFPLLWKNEAPKDCPHQGFFYEDEDEEEY